MIIKIHSDKIYLVLLALVAFTIPLAVTLNNIALGLLLLFWLFSGKLPNKFKSILSNKYFWVFTAIYFIQFVGLLYSSDIQDVQTKLEKKAGLVLLPFILFTIPPLKSKQLFYVIISFAIGCMGLLGYAIAKILLIYGALSKVPQLTEVIDEIIHLHHAYSGLYLVFSIVSCVFFLNKYWFTFPFLARVGILVLIIILYAFLIILGARMALFISFVVLGLQMLLFTIQTKSFRILMVIGLTFLIGLVGVLSLPATRSKLNEILFLRGVYSPFTPRLIQWQCSFDILNNTDSWFKGVGTGDVKPLLQACYQDKKFWGHLYNYNLHNEYLEEMLRHGLLGLSLLLTAFFFPMGVSIKRKNYLYMYFLVIFMFACISESVLNRQKGVIFYAFFNALLFIYLHSATPKLKDSGAAEV